MRKGKAPRFLTYVAGIFTACAGLGVGCTSSTNLETLLPQNPPKIEEPGGGGTSESGDTEGNGNGGAGEPGGGVEEPPEDPSYEEQVQEFKGWAEVRGITLRGINKTMEQLLDQGGVNPEDTFDINGVPNILIAYEGLRLLPDHLIGDFIRDSNRVEGVMRNKTIYLSTQAGRSYAITPDWPRIPELERGVCLEQPITIEDAVHEHGHIVDYYGIRDPAGPWNYLEELKEQIFIVPEVYDPDLVPLPPGYLDWFSTRNRAENFARHFDTYVLDGPFFREMAQAQEAQSFTLLSEKYDFFKDHLFNDIEYTTGNE